MVYSISKRSMIVVLLVVGVASVSCGEKKKIEVGVEPNKLSGVLVHAESQVPVPVGDESRINLNGHGSRAIGGPFEGAQSAGGGVEYQHNNGLKTGIDTMDIQPQNSVVPKAQDEVPLLVRGDGQLNLTVHATRTFGGPNRRAHSEGAALNYKKKIGHGTFSGYGKFNRNRFGKKDIRFGGTYRIRF